MLAEVEGKRGKLTYIFDDLDSKWLLLDYLVTLCRSADCEALAEGGSEESERWEEELHFVCVIELRIGCEIEVRKNVVKIKNSAGGLLPLYTDSFWCLTSGINIVQ